MVSRREWSRLTTADVAVARARGRARYNEIRRVRAAQRTIEIVRRMAGYGFARGAQARVARELRVAPSTVSKALAKLPSPPADSRCPLCGAVRLSPAFEDLIENGLDSTEAGIIVSPGREPSDQL
jgi:hypothetical protein